MSPMFIFGIFAALVLLLAAITVPAFTAARHGQFFANSAIVNVDGNGMATFASADNAFGSRYLIAKRGTVATSIDVCGASDTPLGIVEDETPSDGDLTYPLVCALFGAIKGTRRAQAAAGIAIDALLVPAAGGQLQTLPALGEAAVTYWVVGKAFTAATAQGDQIAIIPLGPYQITVPAVGH